MSTGIYKYENKINGKIYIGLSRNIEGRYTQHIYDSKNQDRKGTGIDYAIRKYGIENFTFEIIELCDESILNEREKYWIEFYDSYHNGYNRTIGGQSLAGENHPKAILTEQDVWNIREQYKLGIKRSEAFEPYLKKGITKKCLLNVWNHKTWVNVHSDVYTEENKNIHKKQTASNQNQNGLSSLDRAIKQEDLDLWLQDFNNGLTINAIANKYNRDNGTIEKYINNPKIITEIKYRGRTVKNVETGKIFHSISSAAKWAQCGATTLTRHLTTDKTAGIIPNTNQKAHWIELS